MMKNDRLQGILFTEEHVQAAKRIKKQHTLLKQAKQWAKQLTRHSAHRPKGYISDIIQAKSADDVADTAKRLHLR